MIDTSAIAGIVTAIVCGAIGNKKQTATPVSTMVVYLVSTYIAYGLSTVIEVWGERGITRIEVEENGDVTVGVEDLPENVQDSLEDYEKNEWKRKSNKSKGTKDDNPFENKEGRLPEKDSQGNDIKYREHDVNDKLPGKGRDAERFVTGSDGSIYYTNDHYGTFIKIK